MTKSQRRFCLKETVLLFDCLRAFMVCGIRWALRTIHPIFYFRHLALFRDQRMSVSSQAIYRTTRLTNSSHGIFLYTMSCLGWHRNFWMAGLQAFSDTSNSIWRHHWNSRTTQYSIHVVPVTQTQRVFSGYEGILDVSGLKNSTCILASATFVAFAVKLRV